MEPDLNNPEQIKLLIGLLQKLLPQEDTGVSKPKKKKITKKIENEEDSDEFNNPNIRTKSTKMPKRSTNKFLSMPEKDMHKSDSIIDKKLAISPPSPRTRRYQPIQVKCRSCGKTEKVNPAILPDSADRYKCNQCSTSAS